MRELRLDPRLHEHRVDLAVEPVNNLGGRFLRRAYSGPRAYLEALQKLTHGWNVRQHFRARLRRYRQRTKLARPDLFDRCGQIVERRRYLTAEQAGDHRCRTPVRNVDHLETAGHLEQFAGNVRDRAGPE